MSVVAATADATGGLATLPATHAIRTRMLFRVPSTEPGFEYPFQPAQPYETIIINPILYYHNTPPTSKK